jgi:hypothetical protein
MISLRSKGVDFLDKRKQNNYNSKTNRLTLSGISDVIGIISFILAILIKYSDYNKNLLIDKILMILMITTAIIFIVSAIIINLNYSKKKKSIEYEIGIVTERMKRKAKQSINIDLLGYYFNLFSTITKEGINYLNKNDTTNKTLLEGTLNSVCETLVKYVEDLFSALTKNSFYVSIKIGVKNDGDKIKTLCTSNNVHRTSKDEYIISNWTIFRKLHRDELVFRYFASNNLIEYKKGLEKNGEEFTGPDTGWENHYKSLIVAPIKRNGDTLGFLCIDSKKIDAFGDNLDGYANITVAVSNILYFFLETLREFDI